MNVWLRLILRTGLVITAVVAILTKLAIFISPPNAHLTFVVSEGGTLHIDQFDGWNQSRLIDGLRLTDSQIEEDSQLSWSPDGTRLIFLATPQNAPDSDAPPIFQTAPQIWMYDVRDDGLYPLADLPADYTNLNWSWSADSRRLAYSDGTRVTIITPGSPEIPPQTIDPGVMGLLYVFANTPLWSPVDPDVLVLVVAYPNQQGGNIALVEPNHPEAGARLLLNNPTLHKLLSWRADGQGLIYSRHTDNGTSVDVYYDLRTQVEQPINSRHRHLEGERGSSDGRQIAYTIELSDESCGLFLIDVRTKIQQRILPNELIACYIGIAWQPSVDGG
jgi:Tol biopolymer transport system component